MPKPITANLFRFVSTMNVVAVTCRERGGRLSWGGRAQGQATPRRRWRIDAAGAWRGGAVVLRGAHVALRVDSRPRDGDGVDAGSHDEQPALSAEQAELVPSRHLVKVVERPGHQHDRDRVVEQHHPARAGQGRSGRRAAGAARSALAHARNRAGPLVLRAAGKGVGCAHPVFETSIGSTAIIFRWSRRSNTLAPMLKSM